MKSVQPAWHEIVCDTLKANSVRLVTYVPDNVLKPLIKAAHEDSYFTTFVTTREEEAVGIVAGACMAGMRGIVLMQTSGFATLANVIASLPVAFQIPVLLMISERGVMGEFNLGQAMVNRTMRPVLDSLAMVNHTITRMNQERSLLYSCVTCAQSARKRSGSAIGTSPDPATTIAFRFLLP